MNCVSGLNETLIKNTKNMLAELKEWSLLKILERNL